jgi:hydroxycarboxylate dehydrogenase B
MPVIEATRLRQFVSRLFQAAGVVATESDWVAESLVESNLCGHESHGVVRVMEYIDLIRAGDLRSDVELKTVSETGGLLVSDAQLGFGQVQMRKLLDRLEDKARTLGIAVGTVTNCGHVGRLGEWCQLLAERGLASWLTVNDNGVLTCVAPPGGTEPRISTNPIAIGVPNDDTPIVLDISTSVVANGKIRVAQISGEQCPDGWIIDHNGLPTNDPNVRFNDPKGSILPMGGYKGFGLGLLLDMLVGGLSGGQSPPADEGEIECNNVLMVVFDPEKFAGTDHFKTQVNQLTEFTRNTPTRSDTQAIRLPGDRSTQLRAQRLQDGLPLDDGTWNALATLATELDVTCELDSRKASDH